MDKRFLDKNRYLVNTREIWEPLTEMLGERLSSLRVLLEKANDPTQIYRLQGEISNVKWMLSLREKING